MIRRLAFMEWTFIAACMFLYLCCLVQTYIAFQWWLRWTDEEGENGVWERIDGEVIYKWERGLIGMGALIGHAPVNESPSVVDANPASALRIGLIRPRRSSGSRTGTRGLFDR